jgi:dTMP kinase
MNMDLQVDKADLKTPESEARQPPPRKGEFITFEGGEGTGKSTQAAMLALRLEALGIGVLLTREPGGSPGAEIIRYVLLSGAAKPLGPDAEAILFAAARNDHVDSAIKPALDAGKWVLCDRFADSTRVYQGALGAVDSRIIKSLERVAIGDLAPSLTFVLDLPVEAGLGRRKQRAGDATPDRFEAEDVEFHEKLRQAYLALAEHEPRRCIVIDAGRGKEEIAKQIWTIVNSRLEPGTASLSVETMAS